MSVLGKLCSRGRNAATFSPQSGRPSLKLLCEKLLNVTVQISAHSSVRSLWTVGGGRGLHPPVYHTSGIRGVTYPINPLHVSTHTIYRLAAAKTFFLLQGVANIHAYSAEEIPGGNQRGGGEALCLSFASCAVFQVQDAQAAMRLYTTAKKQWEASLKEERKGKKA